MSLAVVTMMQDTLLYREFSPEFDFEEGER
jgi:hypothetical protein